MTPYGNPPDWSALVDEHDQLTPEERRRHQRALVHEEDPELRVRTATGATIATRPIPRHAPEPGAAQRGVQREDRAPRRDRWNRSLDYRRTRYRPGPAYCPCRSCLDLRANPSTRAELLQGDGNPKCCYVNREKVFAEAWERENRRQPGINYGHGILQDLMVTQREARKGDAAVKNPHSIWSWLRVAFVVSPRERVIVATVIQWLGTNVGFSWLCEVLNRCGYEVRPKKGD